MVNTKCLTALGATRRVICHLCGDMQISYKSWAEFAAFWSVFVKLRNNLVFLNIDSLSYALSIVIIYKVFTLFLVFLIFLFGNLFLI